MVAINLFGYTYLKRSIFWYIHCHPVKIQNDVFLTELFTWQVKCLPWNVEQATKYLLHQWDEYLLTKAKV